MQVVPNYSDKSFAVYGNTQPYEDTLRALGGRSNRNLRDGPGWIFSNTKYEPVVQFIAQVNQQVGPPSPVYVTIPAPPMSPRITMPRPAIASAVVTMPPTITGGRTILPQTPLQIFQYTERSIAVIGDTKPFRKHLKAAGGSYNSNLSGHAGWIFSITRYAEVNDLVTRINAGSPLPPIPAKAPKKVTAPTEPLQVYQYGTDIAVLGDTKPFKQQFKVLGGQYRRDIAGRPGWIFPASYYPPVSDFITRINGQHF